MTLLIRDVCCILWDISEYTHAPLGPLAPWVFAGMIGKSPRKLKVKP